MKFKPDWFLPGMVVATVLAWMFPEPGAPGGWMYPELLTKIGVALIFLLHGLGLSFVAMRAGALNWRLHVVVQCCTFVLFPLLGLAMNEMLAERISADLLLGIFFLCAVPSTVSSSVAMTALARGNVAGAVFNATVSSLLGIVLTPLWIAVVIKTTGQAQPMLPVIIDLIRWLVLPLVIGQALRPWAAAWALRHKARISVVDRIVILFLVYASFSDSFKQGVWSDTGAGQLLLVLLICAALFALVMVLIGKSTRALGFRREDRIAAMFCGSKKTLAAGVPMANVIFAAHPGIGLILLPLMIYHQLQLVICGILAERWGRQPEEISNDEQT